MTPKEKCDELFEKYYECNFYTFGFYCKSTAKKCGLICVDEIIEELDFISELMTSNYDWHRNKYWQEVRTEIEKL